MNTGTSVLIASNLFAASVRERVSFNDDWRFQNSGDKNAAFWTNDDAPPYLLENLWTEMSGAGYFAVMRPVDIQTIGIELAIKWDDGSESFFPLEKLRRHCPCADCKGETDIMGNLYKNPEKPLTAKSFQLSRVNTVGGYAIQPVWGDGHSSGIYPFDYLRRIVVAIGD